MVNKVSFSEKHSTIEEIEKFYFYSQQSLIPYFSEESSDFTGFTISELNSELKEHQLALDRVSALEVLAFLEARFRIDYLIRCQERKKDPLSRAFREVYSTKGNRASLVDDILRIWKEINPSYKATLDNFQKALDYRHWLAHGRYWEPKKSPHIAKYDYLGVNLIANNVIENIVLYDI